MVDPKDTRDKKKEFFYFLEEDNTKNALKFFIILGLIILMIIIVVNIMCNKPGAGAGGGISLTSDTSPMQITATPNL